MGNSNGSRLTTAIAVGNSLLGGSKTTPITKVGICFVVTVFVAAGIKGAFRESDSIPAMTQADLELAEIAEKEYVAQELERRQEAGLEPVAETVRVTQNPQSVPLIPGLMPVDVYLNLTNKGFSKTGPKSMPEGWLLWEIEDENVTEHFRVEVWSPASAAEVQSVRAFATNTLRPESETGQIATPFFGYLATLAYDGSTPIEARNWVQTHAGTNATRRFGKVKFELFANAPRSWGLMLTAIE